MNHLLFQVEDRPPLLTSLLLAAQHMLAALGGIIAVPLVVGAALRLPAEQVIALVAIALNLVLPERPVETLEDEHDVPQSFITREPEVA